MISVIKQVIFSSKISMFITNNNFFLCFLQFYGNAPLKYRFEFLYQENSLTNG